MGVEKIIFSKRVSYDCIFDILHMAQYFLVCMDLFFNPPKPEPFQYDTDSISE